MFNTVSMSHYQLPQTPLSAEAGSEPLAVAP
jgi:hypothetical protein